MIFNKKVVVKISNTSESENEPWNLLILHRVFVNECTTNGMHKIFSFVLIVNYRQNYEKTFYKKISILLKICEWGK